MAISGYFNSRHGKRYEAKTQHLRRYDRGSYPVVFDELTDRFGFPEKAWKTFWKEHLAKQPKSADDIGVFLHFGYHHINPIINSILLRREGLNTFNNLCEYIIKRENEKKFRKK
jgi:hypothetical protein